MQLPFFKKKTVGDLYFCLLLKEDAGEAIVLKNENQKLVVAAKEKFKFTNGWEDLVDDIDKTISKLESQIGNTLEETIFFVYSHLIDKETGEIQKPLMDKIKNVVKELELKPIGYIECYEGIVVHYQDKEELPLTAILVEIDKTNLTIFVYKAGKQIYTQSIARTNIITEDLILAFKNLKKESILPSRMIIYNSTDLSREATEIISCRWPTVLFIQTPKVEIIKEEDILKSLVKIFFQQLTKQQASEIEFRTKERKQVLGFVIGGDVERQSEKKRIFKPQLKLPKWQLPQLPKFVVKFKFNNSLFLIIGLITLFLSLLSAEFFLHKAKIKLIYPQISLKDTLNLNEEDLRLKTTSTSAQLSDSKSTTGTRDVGEKATGVVTIYNFDDNERTFDNETQIEFQGIKFSLDDQVKVASASITADGSAKLPGKNKVNITAIDIGEQGNLAKGQRFTIADISQNTAFAINENSLSGGTKKTIKTVAKQDLTELEKSILNKINKEQPNSLIANLKSYQKIVPDLTDYQFTNEKFSKEIGEEASSVDLTAKLNLTYYWFDNNLLLNTINQRLVSRIPQDYEIPPSQIIYKIKNAERDENNKITLTIDINARGIKKIDKTEILKKIMGRTRLTVETMIKNELKARGFQLDIIPDILFFNKMLPIKGSNIELTVGFP